MPTTPSSPPEPPKRGSSRGRSGRRITLAASAAAALLLLSGCETARFYTQAVRGQLQLLSIQRPIRHCLTDPAMDEPTRTKLQLVLELRDFAQQGLALDPGKHYLNYADLKRPYVVWNVYAAPPFSVEEKTWWYPWVGRLSYRGYFNEAQAVSYGETLRAAGWEVYVAGVQAYSTLGWFSDPVLNTFLNHSDHSLAELVFHELAHQRVFVPGDTDFNEAFATAVAAEGVHRWMAASGRSAAREAYERSQTREREFVAMVLQARGRLDKFYQTLPKAASAAPRGRHPPQTATPEAISTRDSIRRELRLEYGRLKERWGGFRGYDTWFSGELNNAQLNTIATYEELVPAFTRLLARCDGNLPRFYQEVATLGRYPRAGRHERLQSAAAQSDPLR